MRKITKYFIATNRTVCELEEFIVALMKHEGWQPLGSPFSTYDSVHQAMVKYEEEN